MRAVLVQELMAFGSEVRPWPEESLLPVDLDVVISKENEPRDHKIQKKPRPSIQLQRRSIQILKLAQPELTKLDDVDGENFDRQPTSGASPSATPNTLIEHVRQRRTERKAGLSLIRRCVTETVERRLQRLGSGSWDPQRGAIVMENTLRTMEGLFQERITKQDRLDEVEIHRQADRICGLNIDILLHQVRVEGGFTSSSSLQVKRPKRMPLVERDPNTADESQAFVTPMFQALKEPNCQRKLYDSVDSLMVLDGDQFVTPIVRRKD